MLRIIVQYLLQPTVLPTFILPVAFYFINRKYIWVSLLITAIIEVAIYWDDLCYYEGRGLMILFMSAQLALMAAIILILKELVPKLKKK